MTRDEATEELRAACARTFGCKASEVSITWRVRPGELDASPDILLPPRGRLLLIDEEQAVAELQALVQERRSQWEQVTVRSLGADDFAARMRAKRS